MHFLNFTFQQEGKRASFFPVGHLDFKHLIFRAESLSRGGEVCAMKFKSVPCPLDLSFSFTSAFLSVFVFHTVLAAFCCYTSRKVIEYLPISAELHTYIRVCAYF